MVVYHNSQIAYLLSACVVFYLLVYDISITVYYQYIPQTLVEL